MVVYSEKFYKDKNNYLLFTAYSDSVISVRITRITKRKYWLDKEEQVYFARYNKSLSISEIIKTEMDTVTQKLKEWK